MGLPSPDLIDRIYDAAFDDALWGDVIAGVVDRAGGTTAVLTTLDIVSGAGTGLPVRQDPSVMNDYFAYWAAQNPLQLVEDPVAYLRGWRPGIMRDHDWMNRDALCATPYFNEFLHPLDADQSMFVRLGLEGTMLTAISIARPEHRGAFQAREIAAAGHYQRHMVRAVRTARRLKVRQDALDHLDTLLAWTDQALLFLDREGRVRRISAAAERLLLDGGVLRLVDGRLAAPDPGTDGRLWRLIAAAVADGARGDAPLSLALPAGRGRVTLTAMPLGPRSLAALSSERFVMLSAVLDPATPAAPTRDIDVRMRFGLTAAEARVALALADGFSLREFADRAGVSVNTARAQLAAIFAKTATRRQADLVRLLLQPTPPASRSN